MPNTKHKKIDEATFYWVATLPVYCLYSTYQYFIYLLIYHQHFPLAIYAIEGQGTYLKYCCPLSAYHHTDKTHSIR